MTFLACCSSQTSAVSLKVGVVFGSGEVRPVARQIFLITSTDLINIWEATKKDSVHDLESIKENLKIEMNYETKIADLRANITRASNAGLSIPRPDDPEVSKVRQDMLTLLYIVDMTPKMFVLQEGATEQRAELMQRAFRPIREEHEDANTLAEVKECGVAVGYFLDEIKKRSNDKENRYWDDISKDLKEIRIRIAKIEDQTNQKRAQVQESMKSIDSIKAEVESRALEEQERQMSTAIKLFMNEVQGKIALIVRTDLKGEASFNLARGGYFILGTAQISDTTIIWNYPITAKERKLFVELSNDNSYAISDYLLSKELAEITSRISLDNAN